MTEEMMHLSHIARVKRVDGTEQLRQSLVTRGLSEELAESDDLFFFQAETSNDLLDSHFTHMSDRTLANYAIDAQEGVAFLRGHNHHELPLGYSLTGVVEDMGGRKRVVSDFYTVPGIAETDDLIKRMKAGLVRDVSVGFHGGEHVCDLCGEDLWNCRHFPGLKYEEKKGEVKVATSTVDNARLSEVSGVFDGSTPQAMILKAQRAAKAGTLTKSQVALLESRYRIALPASRSYSVQHETQGEVKMEIDLVQVRGMLKVEKDEQVIEAIQTLQGRVKELEPQAKDGIQYREDLVTEAISEGVRAQGTDFDTDMYTNTLKTLPIPAIKRMRDDWKKLADKALPAGRHTNDDEGEERTKVTKQALYPDSAFA